MKVLILLACCFVCSLARPEWDDLRVTFGEFDTLPRIRTEAEEQNWTMLDDQCSETDAMFRGQRYWLHNETSVILIFDKNGYIAGIQTSIAQRFKWMPSSFILGTYVLNETNFENHLTMTVYFVEPTTVCTGRNETQFREEGTGTDLYIQSSANPTNASHWMQIPKSQDVVKESMWGNGKCFYDMGQHFWYNVSKTMPCANFFPYCLLYNNGELNAFCFAINDDLRPTERFEHVTLEDINAFVEPVPECYYTDPTFKDATSLHVYFTKEIKEDKC